MRILNFGLKRIYTKTKTKIDPKPILKKLHCCVLDFDHATTRFCTCFFEPYTH